MILRKATHLYLDIVGVQLLAGQPLATDGTPIQSRHPGSCSTRQCRVKKDPGSCSTRQCRVKKDPGSCSTRQCRVKKGYGRLAFRPGMELSYNPETRGPAVQGSAGLKKDMEG